MAKLGVACLAFCFLVVVNFKAVFCEKHDEERIKRESRPAEFFLGNEHHKLNLRYAGHDHVVMVPSKLNVWAVKSTPWTTPNYTYYKFENTEKILNKYRLYEDLDKRATLVAYYEDKLIYYDGVIGESGEMRPVKRAKENWWNENLIDEDKISKPSKDKPLYYDLPKGNDVQEPYLSTEKMDKPLDVLYPKILLVVDHALFKRLGSSYAETLKYMLVYWSAVNMRFKEIEWPKVNIEITGIIIAEDENAMHYINYARHPENPNDISGHKIMDKGRAYFREIFKNETNFYNFDTTVVMTSLNSGALLGSAWIGQVCSQDFNVVFVHDDASYLGIPTGTHELGHHLGIPHDGDVDALGKEKPCSKQTIPKDIGTIMSPIALFYKQKLIWTECSKQSLAKFAWLKAADCLRHRHRF